MPAPSRTRPAYPLLERGPMNGYSTLVATALCVLLGLPSASLAQGGYFGRNKVQYREFDFKVLKTDHFDIYYYPEEEQAAQMASRMAERWYTRLSQLLNHQLSGRQPLILYASGSHFRQTNTVEGEMGEGTGGVTEAYKRRIVLPFAGPIEASDHVLGHELVHAFQYRHHRDERELGLCRRARAAALVHRGDGGVPVDWPRRSADGDVDAGSHAARAAAGRRQARQSKVLPVSVRPRALGVHRGQVWRRRGGQHASGCRRARCHLRHRDQVRPADRYQGTDERLAQR